MQTPEEFSTPQMSARGKSNLIRSVSENPGTKMSVLVGGSEPKSSLPQPEYFVQRWVDYSQKYGLGYMLSDRSTGVIFNDQTKIFTPFD
jgi:hypothetical protein